MEDKKDNRKTARHTWIGDPEESQALSRDTGTVRPVQTDENTILLQRTRVVEKPKKPYSGFITDEELKDSDIIRLEDRRTSMIDEKDISQTRIYKPFVDEQDEKPVVAAPRGPKTRTFVLSDDGKARRLIALLALFLLLVLFEASYFVMMKATDKIPAQTKEVNTQTVELQEENSKLASEVEGYGDKDQITEMKESWERPRDKIAPSE